MSHADETKRAEKLGVRDDLPCVDDVEVEDELMDFDLAMGPPTVARDVPREIVDKYVNGGGTA